MSFYAVLRYYAQGVQSTMLTIYFNYNIYCRNAVAYALNLSDKRLDWLFLNRV